MKTNKNKIPDRSGSMNNSGTINPARLERLFRLGTTSFIFPDHIIPNVEKLGKFFDEIEILAFESRPKKVLPSKEDVKQLLYLSQKLNLTYNIHLPDDVSLTGDSSQKRVKAADTIKQVIDLFSPLTPTTHTLHLQMPLDIEKGRGDQKKLKKWEDNIRYGLGALLSDIQDPGIVSIETLDYPFSFVEKLVEEFNLSVCIDIGHGIRFGHDFLKTFEIHKSRTPILHLHGVDFSGEKRKDHTALDNLPEKHFQKVQKVLNNFEGVVSLEVFNLENLNRSLIFLSKVFNNIVPEI